jgi:hypothetical protein
VSIAINPTEMAATEAWSGGVMIPPGKHVVTVQEAAEGKSSGNFPQIELRLEASDGASIRDWIVVIPQTYGKVKQLFEAAGKPIQDGQEEVTAQALLGCRLLITVQEKPDRVDPSKTRTRVEAYEPVPGQAGVPSASYPPATAQGAGAINDDIPF